MDDFQKECLYCHEHIKVSAKVCFHCGRHQRRIVQYFDRIGILVSILLLILSFWQAREARLKRIEAEEALKRAEAVENQIRESSKAMAKVFLVMSHMDGTISGLNVMQFFPNIMKHEAVSLLNTIHATPDEQKDVYRITNLIREWYALDRQSLGSKPVSPRLQSLEQQIRKLTEAN
jgi:hypothetical protein